MAVIFWILTTIGLAFFIELLIHIVRVYIGHDKQTVENDLIKSLDRLDSD